MNPYRTPGEVVVDVIEQVIAEALPKPEPPRSASRFETMENVVRAAIRDRFERGIEIRFVADAYSPSFVAAAVADDGTARFIHQKPVRFLDSAQMLVDALFAFLTQVDQVLACDPQFSDWPFRRAHGWPE